jgi:tyrosinase
MSVHATAPLELPTFGDRADVRRADLIFYEVDHAGPSYLAHVFVARRRASARTARDARHGYAGAFSVFGHGGCFGEEGHCAIHGRTEDEFDLRVRHPLTPQTRALDVTEALKPVLLDPNVTEVVVTVVVEPAEAAPDAPFELVRLLTYVD